MSNRNEPEDVVTGKRESSESHGEFLHPDGLYKHEPEPVRYSSETEKDDFFSAQKESEVFDENRRTEQVRSLGRSILRFFIKTVLIILMIPWVLILVMRWVPPPLSSFMLYQRFTGYTGSIKYEWIEWDDISPAVPLAVIAAEDQRFLEHRGFDFESIRSAWDEHRAGVRTRGASTISQQVAKNLFLWPGKDIVRKGLEGYVTIIIELIWSKRRILEIYINIAEFSPGIYGIGAASEILFDKLSRHLTFDDAALMAAVLPNPSRLKISSPSSYVLSRRDFIRNQMRKLGGIQLLTALD